ncbi:MAG: DUF4827 family protein [Muribaculaceae bacterium]|nr:DUF4827 family protein [Muribaculaceae bacterium]
MMKHYKRHYPYIIISLLFFLICEAGCDKSQSYSELLRDEEQAVNWYLADQNVMMEVPSDPKDIITYQEAGEDAPFYRLDADGYVYMQVVTADFEDMVDEGDVVYFRFSRDNILFLYQDIESAPTGNSDFLAYGPASFVYKNTTLPSSYTWGTGIQMPLKYVGYNSEVNLVLKSYYGFYDEQSSCVPYLMNLRYFKPEY